MSGMTQAGASGSFVYPSAQVEAAQADAVHSPQAHYAAAAPAEPPHYSYAQQAPYASTSHARAASPPVTLAPIQTDRLVRGGESLPTPLPTLSSTTSLPSAHYHPALARAAPVPHPQQQLHVATHQQYSSVHSPHSAGHDGQVAYSYSSYSALPPGGGHHQQHQSWRPEAFRRSSLTAV